MSLYSAVGHYTRHNLHCAVVPSGSDLGSRYMARGGGVIPYQEAWSPAPGQDSWGCSSVASSKRPEALCLSPAWGDILISCEYQQNYPHWLLHSWMTLFGWVLCWNLSQVSVTNSSAKELSLFFSLNFRHVTVDSYIFKQEIENIYLAYNNSQPPCLFWAVMLS